MSLVTSFDLDGQSIEMLKELATGAGNLSNSSRGFLSELIRGFQKRTARISDRQVRHEDGKRGNAEDQGNDYEAEAR